MPNPAAASGRQESSVDKTIVMPNPAGSTGSVRAGRQESSVDKTIVMPNPAATCSTPSPAQSGQDARKEELKSKAETVRQFLTGRLPIFGRTKDIDLVVGHHKTNTSSVDFEKVEEPLIEHWNLTDRFTVYEPFAGGGQGILSKGEDIQLKRLVAIKTLREELCGDTKQRSDFVAEARVTAQLDHPSIIPIYSLNTDEQNGLHMVMKLINGQDFKTY